MIVGDPRAREGSEGLATAKVAPRSMEHPTDTNKDVPVGGDRAQAPAGDGGLSPRPPAGRLFEIRATDRGGQVGVCWSYDWQLTRALSALHRYGYTLWSVLEVARAA
jgi:hypothetical protein